MEFSESNDTQFYVTETWQAFRQVIINPSLEQQSEQVTMMEAHGHSQPKQSKLCILWTNMAGFCSIYIVVFFLQH